MIILDLKCADGHRFEGWFSSTEAFSKQLEAGQVCCPSCESTSISRVPSAVHLGAPARDLAQPQSNEDAPSQQDVQRLLMNALKTIADQSENVGDRFSEEVRRIHYSEAPERPIRGVASAQETRDLLGEGIPILPLPFPKDEDIH